MTVKADEISSILRSQIEHFAEPVATTNVGTVVEVHDGIARVYGLSGAMANELLEFPNGLFGLALNLEEETVGVVLLGSDVELHEGDQVKTTGRIVQVPVGDAMVGRVVNALAQEFIFPRFTSHPKPAQ